MNLICVRPRVLAGAAVLLATTSLHSHCSGASFLFDATRAQMAGNADWVIDADLHNLNVTNGNGSGTLGTGGADSNPQRVPTPSASGITASTSETYWQGALSAWGVNLVQRSNTVESLPYNGKITFGNASNAQDLSHYSAFVVDEPNILFTAAEKTALIQYVASGGGLFMVSDHTGSDRNNDGADAVEVWNDLATNNSIATNPFGITFNANDLSGVYSKVDPSLTDQIVHGSAGTATKIAYADGATITIDKTKNASATIAIHTTSTTSLTDGVMAYATYGLGHVVALGDSSPADDGTGDTGDTLYNGWTDSTATDNIAILNGSLYAASGVVPEPAMIGVFAGPAAMLLLRVRRSSNAKTQRARR